MYKKIKGNLEKTGNFVINLWKSRKSPAMIRSVQIYFIHLMVQKAIVKCLQNTWCDEGIILSKAARIVHAFLSTKEKHLKETFLKTTKIVCSASILKFGISYIRRRSNNWKCIGQCWNLTQLLRFNAVKAKRICDEFLRHSKSNESPFPVNIGPLVHLKQKRNCLLRS